MNWYIWSFEHKQWWRPQHRGYTSHLNEAGLYSSDEVCTIISLDVLRQEIPVAPEQASDYRWPAKGGPK
jgi:hypothetical protein